MTPHLKPLPILADSTPANAATESACSEIFRVWSIYLPAEEAQAQADAFARTVRAAPVAPTADLERQAAQQLAAVGLRLSHVGDGYRLYDGNQILAGHEFGLSLDQISEFARRVAR
jgi:hypothetical protein